MNNDTKVVLRKEHLANVTDDVMVSIISLKEDQRFKNIIEWLRASKERDIIKLIKTVAEPQRTIIQGNLQMLTTILEVIDESLGKMQEFRMNQKKG